MSVDFYLSPCLPFRVNLSPPPLAGFST